MTIEDTLGAGPGPVTITLADVPPERVAWLWPGRLPAGKLVVLDGDPSVGKSSLAIDWAARMSTGTAWPDGAHCSPGDVLILSAEDGLADTIRPRLDAANGDPARVHSLTGMTFRDDDGDLRPRGVSLADAGTIAAAVERHRARLVIVDVLMAYLPTGVDSHRDQDVRTVLAGLSAMAEHAGCTVVLLRHLNKTSGGSPLYRGGGSIGIVGAARAAYLAAVDPDDDSGARRVLAASKANLAPLPSSLAYELSPTSNGAAAVTWHGETETTAARLLTVVSEDERTERDVAAAWLVDYLAECGGSAVYKNVTSAGRVAGFGERRLRRAHDRAGVIVERVGSFQPTTTWRLQSGHRGHQLGTVSGLSALGDGVSALDQSGGSGQESVRTDGGAGQSGHLDPSPDTETSVRTPSGGPATRVRAGDAAARPAQPRGVDP